MSHREMFVIERIVFSPSERLLANRLSSQTIAIRLTNDALKRRRVGLQTINASVLFTVFMLDVNVSVDLNVSSLKNSQH